MELLLFPLVGALIGWVTNRLAVRLLFRPYRPLGLPGFKLQGLLPRRRHELAETIARIVAQELVSHHDLSLRILDPAARTEMAATVAEAVERAVRARIPFFVPRPAADLLVSLVQQSTRSELESFMRDRLPGLVDGLVARVDIAGTVRDRINGLDLAELEGLVYRLARRELGHIEWLGAAVGGAVGIIQALILRWIWYPAGPAG
ncbi:MAG: DUF445 family protein [Thermaerobacterales bacterium]